jgi:Uridine kinase
MKKTFLIAINALSGGGKTTVTQRLKEMLDNVDV